MHKPRRILAATAGLALVGGGLSGLATPAAAAPVDPGDGQAAVPAAAQAATAWEEPVPGTSAEIEFTDAATPAPAAAISPYLAEIVREATQVRTVDIDAGALEPSLTAESVAVELFEDVDIALETNVALSEGAGTSGTYSAGGEDGAATITVVDGDVHGAFWQGATRYGIEPLGGGQHLVYEDGRTFPDERGLVAPEDATGAPSPAAPGDPADPADPGLQQATVVIDVMVAYDDLALAMFGSLGALEDEIIEMINVSNMIYANSLNDQQISLTNIYDLDYLPNAADGTDDDLDYIAAIRSKTDGIVDNLHTARDANDADLAAVITDMSSFCGLGYYPSSGNPPEIDAYSTTDGSCAVGNMTFTHELGHNMCADHDPVNASSSLPCEPDGYGHFSIADSLRTVMSYANADNGCTGCTRVPYFSNPDVTVSGWTTGVLGERDNSRVLEIKAPDIAAYRTPGGGPAPCEVDYTISDTWTGNVQVDLVVENTTTVTMSGWTAEWTFTGDESVYNSWGTIITQTGPDATAVGDGFGDQIPGGGSVTVGFQATVTGTPTVPPAVTCAF